jgi:TRAP-type mannitol/chloroaromatic compound transport system permease small subunit
MTANSERKPAPSADVLDQIAHKASSVGRELAAIAIIATMALVALNTVARVVPYVNALHFVEEYSGYLFIAATYLGLADTLRNDGHVRVVFILQRLMGRHRALLEAVLAVIAILVVSALSWFAANLFAGSLQSGERAQSMTQTPLWIPRAVILPGYLLLLLELIVLLRRNLRAFNALAAGAEPDTRDDA